MPELLLDNFRGDPEIVELRGMNVPELVPRDLADAGCFTCRLQDFLQQVGIAVRSAVLPWKQQTIRIRVT